MLSLSFRLGRILKPIWAVTRQATCNCKPQRPPTSTDFLQGSSLYISTTIMWGRGGATFQNPHFLFRRRDDDPMSLKLPVNRDHHAVYVSSCRLVLLMLSCSCLTRCFNRPALLEKTLRAKVDFFVLRGSCHLGSSRGLCLSAHHLELCLWRGSALDTTTS